MVPTFKVVVVTDGGAASVSIVPPKFDAPPTATQLAGLAQDTPNNDATPEVAGRLDQALPPSIVLAIVVPPTTVQEDWLMQLTEANVVVPAGVPRSVHSEPPSVVPMTCEPLAVQSESLGQETPVRESTPAGTDWGVHVVPPLVVPRMTAPGPPEAEPTAVQWNPSAQEMPVKFVTVAGNVSVDQMAPSSVVTRMLGEAVPKSLTAWQTDALEHETEVNTPTPLGTV